jgi:hypothetical protein
MAVYDVRHYWCKTIDQVSTPNVGGCGSRLVVAESCGKERFNCRYEQGQRGPATRIICCFRNLAGGGWVELFTPADAA